MPSSSTSATVRNIIVTSIICVQKRSQRPPQTLRTFIQQNVDLEAHVLLHLQFDAPKHDGDLRHFLHHVADVQS